MQAVLRLAVIHSFVRTLLVRDGENFTQESVGTQARNGQPWAKKDLRQEIANLSTFWRE
jgi:transcriptional antiterminator Rof (Rho-off)